MRLVPKVSLTLAAIAAVMVTAVVALSLSVVWPSFDRLDREDAAHRVARVYEALERERTGIQRQVTDWAVFDDAYAYAGGEASSYIASNMFYGPLSNIGVNYVGVFHPNGRKLFTIGLDFERGQETQFAALPNQTLSIRHPLVTKDSNDGSSGLIATDRGLVMIGSSPILRSDGTGPSRGTLLMGRLMTPAILETLSQQTGVQFQLHLATDVQGHLVAQSRESAPMIVRTDHQTNLSYMTVFDLYGKPAYVIEAKCPRTVAAIGRQTLMLMTLVLVGSVCVLLLVMGGVLNRLVLRRIRSLTRDVLSARRAGHFPDQGKRERGDEITVLGRAFGALYASEAHKQKALQEARIQAEAATEAKSRFLAMMSHEIRTPLNGVLAMAYHLRDTKLSAPQRHQVATIVTSGEALLDILNDILDVSKVEAGKLEIAKESFRPADIVRDVTCLYQQTAEDKGITYEVDVALPKKSCFMGDSLRVRQILQNLISNAIKFTEKGVVSVRASLEAGGSGTDRYLILKVQDTGPGIPQDLQKKLFERFEQTDVSITRKYGGTGLGLALVRELTHLMGGTVAVDSTVGKGSTFTVRIPVETASCVIETPENTKQDLQSADRQLVILAVDDNATNRLVLKTLLEPTGAEIDMAVNGLDAVEQARHKTYDLIIMDVHMPEMDGMTATRTIRAENGPNQTTPIVALTADAFPEQVRACLDAGMNAHIVKPIRPDGLYGTLASVLMAEQPPATLEKLQIKRRGRRQPQ